VEHSVNFFILSVDYSEMLVVTDDRCVLFEGSSKRPSYWLHMQCSLLG